MAVLTNTAQYIKCCHVLTTVGTSILTNYDSALDKHFLSDVYDSKAHDEKKYKSLDSLIQQKISTVVASQYSDVSAEIASTLNYLTSLNSECTLQIHLLCSDTNAAYLSATLIKYFFDTKQTEIKTLNGQLNSIEVKLYKIDDLLVDDAEKFKNYGLKNLFNELNQIRKSSETLKGEQQFVVNITGGYKGLIPVMTTYAHLYNLTTIYLYQEDSNFATGLIRMDSVPMNIDQDKVNDVAYYLDQHKLYNPTYIKENRAVYNYLERNNYIYKNGSRYALSAIGIILQSYATHKSNYSRDLLSFMVEHKCYEFLVSNGYPDPNVISRDRVERSVRIRNQEIDLVIISDSSCVLGEVKSLGQIENDYDKVLQKFNANVNAYMQSNADQHLAATFYALYSYLPLSDDRANKLKRIISAVSTPSGKPLDVYYIQVKEKPNVTVNILQSFYQEKLKPQDFRLLFTCP